MRETQFRTVAKIVETPLRTKSQLMIHTGNLPATAEELRDLLATSETLFDRGMPVRVVTPATAVLPVARPLTKNNVVMQAHKLCQPMKAKANGEIVSVTLTDRLAMMYLDMTGEWNLRPLDGISVS